MVSRPALAPAASSALLARSPRPPATSPTATASTIAAAAGVSQRAHANGASPREPRRTTVNAAAARECGEDHQPGGAVGHTLAQGSLQRRDASESGHGGCRDDARTQRQRSGAKLPARRGQRDEDDEPERRDGDRAARVGDVEAGAQRDGGAGGRRADGHRARAVAGEPSAQHEADSGQGALAVPVGDRLLEAAAGAARAIELDDPRQQPAANP